MALGLDPRNAVAAQRIQKLSLHHAHPGDQGPFFAGLLRGVEGALDIVQRSKQVGRQRGVGEPALLREIALKALLVIFEVGLGSCRQIEILLALLLRGLQLRLQRRQIIRGSGFIFRHRGIVNRRMVFISLYT